MVKPISLRLSNAEIRARAEATLIRAGRADDLKRAHTARVMREARATVARAQEQARLKRAAALAAHKALLSVKDAFAKIRSSTTSDVDQQRWRERQELVEVELMRIIEGARRS